MTTDFLHGVEVVTVDSGPRPIQTIRSAVIGLIGTAPLADASKFPLDEPVLVNSRGGIAGLGADGTLPKAMDAIFKQTGAFVVVVRVAQSEDANVETARVATIANVIGGIDTVTGEYKGAQAFRKAESALGISPMILIAPEFTGERPNGVKAVPVTAQGSGYTSAPTVTFTGGTGSGAAAHAVLGTGADAGKVVSIVVDNAGRYSAAPTATLTGGGGTGATLGTVTLGDTANPVTAALVSVANMLRAHVVKEGPNTTDAAAIADRGDWGTRRVFLVDPAFKTYDAETGGDATAPNSAFVAGLIARIDHEIGFWKSPSNEVINGITGLARAVDWALGDPNTRANLLNENEVATVIRDDGFRLWGNRTASDDPKWAFLCVSRTADMIDMSIQRAHRWAVDRAINKGYYDDVVASVKGYLRQLKARGAILGGDCWVDPDFNTAADITNGNATFSYHFTPVYPAERVTFRSSITDEYITSLFDR